MKEFLLLIRNEPNHFEGMTSDQQQIHIQRASKYIEDLTQQGKMKGAQPLSMNGVMLANSGGVFKDGPFIESKEVIGGFFHIVAEDLEEAVRLAKGFPDLVAGNSRIEVREIAKAEGIN